MEKLKKSLSSKLVISQCWEYVNPCMAETISGQKLSLLSLTLWFWSVCISSFIAYAFLKQLQGGPEPEAGSPFWRLASTKQGLFATSTF